MTTKQARKENPVGKRLRFEVFKRDSFKCQYCGRSAPEVLLHIDHIKAIANGGKSNITNLITACQGCNAGKSSIPLSDSSAISKSMLQAAELQQRREQLELLMEWQSGLADIDREKTDMVASFWSELVNPFHLTERGLTDLRKMLMQFGASSVLESMRESVVKCLKRDADGKPTKESVEDSWTKVGCFCIVNKASLEDPELKELYYIRGIIRKRLDGKWFIPHQALNWLKAARSWGVDMEELKDIAREVYSWPNFGNKIDAAIEIAKRKQS